MWKLEKFLTTVFYVLVAVILFKLIWRYPAATVLFPVYLFYGTARLGIPKYMKKKKDGKRMALAPFNKCIVQAAVTDFYGMVNEEEEYLLFNILCCVDGIVMCVDLIFEIKNEILLTSIYAGKKKTDQNKNIENNSGEKNEIQSKIAQEDPEKKEETRPGRKDGKSKRKRIPRQMNRKASRCLALFIILYVALGACLPFVNHPVISGSTMDDFDSSVFYSDEISGEQAKVISQNDEALEERIRLISQAQDEIILSTFEMDADTSGKMIMAALMEAAGRGVQVRLLADGIPYLKAMWGNPYFLALAQMENVEIQIYNPVRPWKPWTIMGRLHDKYLIADETAYILGGRNTYDYFLGDQEGYKNYDWDVLVYSEKAREENSLYQVRDYFSSVWGTDVCRTLADNHFWEKNPSVISAEKELWNVYEEMEKKHGDWFLPIDYGNETDPVNHIELVSNPTDIFSKEPVVYYTITELMMQAQASVTFHTPYIICNDWMQNRLENICEKVDNVTMMTNSVANNGNLFGAADYYFNKEEILKTGVNILEYDGGISYHGKCFVIDDRLSGIGSFNWDMRSAYVDTELMLVIDSEEVNEQLRKEMRKYEKDALTVVDSDTSIAPEGQEAQVISPDKNTLIQILRYFNWARFLM